MKKLLFLAAMLPVMFFSSCSDDDKEKGGGEGGGGTTSFLVDPSVVFPNKAPKTVAGMTITRDKDGLVTKITDENGNIATFEYESPTRVIEATQRVKMTVKDEEETYLFDLLLGYNGFVKSCEQTYITPSETTKDTWTFRYNTDEQLNYMKRSEGDNEVTTITYKDGNITEVNMVSEGDPKDKMKATISYTTMTEANIENKGSVMLFDETFGIDMDEMKYVYYAGMLGKATKHLPLKVVFEDEDGKEENLSFQWYIYDSGYPDSVRFLEEDGSDDETYEFTW